MINYIIYFGKILIGFILISPIIAYLFYSDINNVDTYKTCLIYTLMMFTIGTLLLFMFTMGRYIGLAK